MLGEPVLDLAHHLMSPELPHGVVQTSLLQLLEKRRLEGHPVPLAQVRDLVRNPAKSPHHRHVSDQHLAGETPVVVGFGAQSPCDRGPGWRGRAP